MRIEIHYQKKSAPSANMVVLASEVYFDPLEPGETYESDGIPRHNYASDYLRCDLNELSWTEIHVLDCENAHTIRTEYYGPETSMWHRKNSDGYEEICIETKIADSRYHLARLHKGAQTNWTINYNGIIDDFPDGSQQETKIFPKE